MKGRKGCRQRKQGKRSKGVYAIGTQGFGMGAVGGVRWRLWRRISRRTSSQTELVVGLVIAVAHGLICIGAFVIGLGRSG